jgi:hypothetical protein
MTPSQAAAARWPKPNVAMAASENGPDGLISNDAVSNDVVTWVPLRPEGSAPRRLRCQPGLTVRAYQPAGEWVRMAR